MLIEKSCDEKHSKKHFKFIHLKTLSVKHRKWHKLHYLDVQNFLEHNFHLKKKLYHDLRGSNNYLIDSETPFMIRKWIIGSADTKPSPTKTNVLNVRYSGLSNFSKVSKSKVKIPSTDIAMM